MRIIDERGMLFGKINIIDFLVIIFLFGLTPFFYFGYKIFVKKPPVNIQEVVVPREVVSEELNKNIIEIELPFDLVKLTPGIVKLISLGDKEFDDKGQDIAEIIHLDKFEPQVYRIDLGSGQDQDLLKKDPILQHVLATLKIKAELKQNNIYYKDKQIVIDNPINFRTDKYQVEAFYVPPQSVQKEPGSSSTKEEMANQKESDFLSTKEEMANIWETVSSLQRNLGQFYTRLVKIEIYLKNQELKGASIKKEKR